MRKLLVLVVLLATAQAATAKSMYTKFTDAMEKSAIIAIARFDGARPGQVGALKSCVLEFTEVLKGDLKAGKHIVSWAEGYTPRVERSMVDFVAFLDKDLVWHYAAAPFGDNLNVAESPLRMHGFFDFNAHHVEPSLITVELLKTYAKKGTLEYSFRGPLCFPVKGKGTWEASKIVLDVTHDPIKKTSSVTGLPELKGLGKHEVTVSSLPFRDGVVIEFWGRRSLRLGGEAKSLDVKNGTFQVRFFAILPDILSQKEFEGYVADAEKGAASYRVKLTATGGDKKTMTLHLNASGAIGRLSGWSASEVRFSSASWNKNAAELCSDRAEDGKEIVVRIDTSRVPRGAGRVYWTFQNTLLYDLYTGELPGVVEVRDRVSKKVSSSLELVAAFEGVSYEKASDK